MAKKYSTTYLIYTFKIRDIVPIAILAKNWAVNNTPKIETHIIDILFKNKYTL